MSRQLLIFLGESLMSPIQWGVIEDERLLEAGRIPGAEALSNLRRRQQDIDKTIAFLPGEQATLRHMETPPKTAAKFKAAAAYLLEDDLSEPLDQLHYATQLNGNGGFVLAIRDEIIQNWADVFAAANFDVDVLTTDTSALANISDDIILLRGKSRTVAGAPTTGMACENDLFDLIGGEFLDTVGDKRVQCLGEEQELPAFLKGKTVDWLGPFGKGRLFEFFAQALLTSAPVNLLQDKYRRKIHWGGRLNVWRHVGVIATGLGCVFLASLAAEAWRNDRESSQWAELSQELHNQHFPDVVGADPVNHARIILASGADSASFLLLSTRFAEAIEKNEEVQIDRIGFDSTQGRYTVSIRSQSDTAIEALRADLTAMGVTVRDNGGYRQSRGQWIGELLAEIS